MPRTEAEALIARAFCILSPGDAMGWGQIGDAWMADTPVIAAREHYDLRADDNGLIAPTASAFVAAVRQLRAQAAERARLAEGGQRSVAAHAVERVAATLHDLLAHAVLALAIVGGPVAIIGKARAVRAARRSRRLVRRLNWYGNVR